MDSSRSRAPHAHVILRAHSRAPARVELRHCGLPGRLLRTIGWLAICWGSIPFLLWVPPHYPWVAAAFFGGIYLAHRSWTGRYQVVSFAGICPRCGAALSIGPDRTIDLPHTLTCFTCHFEPQLEILFSDWEATEDRLEHGRSDCTGTWETRWLADERFLHCQLCHAGAPASPRLKEQAEREDELRHLLVRLSDEGEFLI
jgi:hypothetical protein